MSESSSCWCSGDVKCPHSVEKKLVSVWEDAEKSIDVILQEFDRKTIKTFLKRDLDGNTKNSQLGEKLQEVCQMIKIYLWIHIILSNYFLYHMYKCKYVFNTNIYT